MVCFIWLLFLVFSTTFVCAESDGKLVSLNCQSENHGVFGQDTLLKCSATCKNQVMEIVSLVWRHAGQRKPLVIHSKDSGEDNKVISLKVTANYMKPKMNSVPEKDIKDDDEVTIFCNASGGFPKGMIHWFDQIGTNWTRSAELTEGEEEDSEEFTLQFKQQQLGTETSEDDKNTKAIVAISVVIGSLVVGLLVLVLVRQWRSRRPQYVDGYSGSMTVGEYTETQDVDLKNKNLLSEDI
ncbi:hypothetical protein AGOR_G00098390 [Albula goreensis]|uniref:Ig-like domain-containing protein n=1 Tax=Albula goreensis TaxID=1534307 RepID=A0A8T3DR92_9TELE|nr:hypothetical protein AGOR_G00098390 [Albula goreensis]